MVEGLGRRGARAEETMMQIMQCYYIRRWRCAFRDFPVRLVWLMLGRRFGVQTTFLGTEGLTEGLCHSGLACKRFRSSLLHAGFGLL